MAARVGLDREAVLVAAMRIVDDEGVAALHMARLSEDLGIRTPSLYAHVTGLEELWRELRLRAVEDMGEALRAAVGGRDSEDALFAFGAAFRGYALTFPGRYRLTTMLSEFPDDEAEEARQRARDLFRSVIRSFGLDADPSVHASRTVWSAIYGFVALEADRWLGRDKLDASFQHMIATLARGLRAEARTKVAART